MKRIMICTILLLFPCTALAGEGEFSVTPQAIQIHALYNGSTIRAEGMVPEGSQVVLRFLGAPGDVDMEQKGKALGLLWMNMGNVRFDKVPAVFLVASSAPLADMGSAGAALGMAGLAGQVGIEPDDADRNVLLPELLKLKQDEGLYREMSGTVTMGPAKDGMQPFTADMPIPSRLSPGDYAVEVHALKDGREVFTASRAMDVKMVGIPFMMADLAFNHGVWYGVLASVIAILAGLGIGLVFQSKEAH